MFSHVGGESAIGASQGSRRRMDRVRGWHGARMVRLVCARRHVAATSVAVTRTWMSGTIACDTGLLVRPWLDLGVRPAGAILDDFDGDPEQRGNSEGFPPHMTVTSWAWFPTL